MLKKLILIRDVSVEQCPWLIHDLNIGTVLFKKDDIWGVCSKDGQAVSLTSGIHYFELPKDALKEIPVIDFSIN